MGKTTEPRPLLMLPWDLFIDKHTSPHTPKSQMVICSHTHCCHLKFDSGLLIQTWFGQESERLTQPEREINMYDYNEHIHRTEREGERSSYSAGSPDAYTVNEGEMNRKWRISFEARMNSLCLCGHIFLGTIMTLCMYVATCVYALWGHGYPTLSQWYSNPVLRPPCPACFPATPVLPTSMCALNVWICGHIFSCCMLSDVYKSGTPVNQRSKTYSMKLQFPLFEFNQGP